MNRVGPPDSRWRARGRAWSLLVCALLSAFGLSMAGSAVAKTGRATAPLAFAPAACVLLCPPTTTPTPTTPAPVTAPQAFMPSVSDITATSAVLSAKFNLGSEPATYYLEWADTSTTTVLADTMTPIDQPGATGLTTSDKLTKLTPGAQYTARLVVYTATQKSVSPQILFRTPLEPALRVSVTVPKTKVLFASTVPVHVTIHGADPGDTVVIQEASTPYKVYADVTQPVAVSGSHFTIDTVAVINQHFRAVLLGKDTSGRVFRTPSISRPSPLIYTYPHPTVSYTPDADNPNDVDAVYSVGIRPVGSHYVGARVYFYRATSRQGPFSLLGSARLRYAGDTTGGSLLTAKLTIPVAGTIVVATCTKHAIRFDMGKPYTIAACGRPTI